MTREERTARIKELEEELAQLKSEDKETYDHTKFEDDRLRILGEAVKKVKDMTKEDDGFTAFVSASISGKQSIFFGLGTEEGLSVLLAVAVKQVGEVLRNAFYEALLIASRMR